MDGKLKVLTNDTWKTLGRVSNISGPRFPAGTPADTLLGYPIRYIVEALEAATPIFPGCSLEVVITDYATQTAAVYEVPIPKGRDITVYSDQLVQRGSIREGAD
jgi:hypothetical protein